MMFPNHTVVRRPRRAHVVHLATVDEHGNTTVLCGIRKTGPWQQEMVATITCRRCFGILAKRFHLPTPQLAPSAKQ
jgi:hypothetical protein